MLNRKENLGMNGIEEKNRTKNYFALLHSVLSGIESFDTLNKMVDKLIDRIEYERNTINACADIISLDPYSDESKTNDPDYVEHYEDAFKRMQTASNSIKVLIDTIKELNRVYAEANSLIYMGHDTAYFNDADARNPSFNTRHKSASQFYDVTTEFNMLDFLNPYVQKFEPVPAPISMSEESKE